MNRLPVALALLLLTLSPGCRTSSKDASNGQPPLMITESLGESVRGRPILLHRFGEGPVSTLSMAGIHGDEPTGIAVAGYFVNLLQNGEVPEFEGTVAVIPI